MAKKRTHGGKRAGAGRPLANPDEGKAVVIAASVPGELVELLDRIAKQMGWNRSQAITEAIRGLLDAKHGR